jgi:hypothetical protein
MAANLVLHANTPLPMAWDATLSMANAFFDSSPFEDHRKGLENKAKTVDALFARINNVVTAITGLGRALARR